MFTSYLTLDSLVNMSRPNFLDHSSKQNPSKCRRILGQRILLEGNILSKSWHLAMARVSFRMEKLEEVDIFMESRTAQKPSLIF